MIDKNVNYAYGPSPVRMAEGGVARQSYAPVEQKREARDFSTPSPNASPPPAPPAEDARKQIYQSPADARGNVVTTIYDQYGNMEGSSNNSQAQVDAGIFGADTNEKYKVVSQLIPQDQNSGGNYAPYSAENRPNVAPPGPSDYLGSGATLIEHDGKMVSQDAMTALNMSVGNQAEDMRYDANGDGKLSAGDALEFMKYAKMENYGDDSGFMSGFYGDQPGGMDGTSPIVGGGVEYTMPVMPPPAPAPLPAPVPLPRPDNPFATLPVPGGPKPFNPFNPVGGTTPVVPNDPTVGIPPMPNPFDPAPPPVFGGPAPVNPFPQLPTGAQGGRTYGNAPVFGGFNPGKNIPTDDFGNPIAVPFNNGGIAGLRR